MQDYSFRRFYGDAVRNPERTADRRSSVEAAVRWRVPEGVSEYLVEHPSLRTQLCQSYDNGMEHTRLIWLQCMYCWPQVPLHDKSHIATPHDNVWTSSPVCSSSGQGISSVQDYDQAVAYHEIHQQHTNLTDN